MTALRWFLSYLLPILIIASIATAYFFREQISADWYRTLSWPVVQINAVLQQQKLQLSVLEPAVASNLVSDKIPATVELAEKKSTKNQSSSATTNGNDDDEQSLIHPVKPMAKTEADTSMPPIIEQASTMPTLPKTPLIAESTIQTKQPESTKIVARAPQAQQPFIPYPQPKMLPPLMRPPLSQYKQLPATVFKLNNKQRKLLYQARKAYWTREFKKARKHYLALITQLPDNPDFHGELGNLFYSERKLEFAIKHYTLAAKLVIKHRHFWKLNRIMQVISRFNPAKANEVMMLMRNRHSTSANNTTTLKKGK